MANQSENLIRDRGWNVNHQSAENHSVYLRNLLRKIRPRNHSDNFLQDPHTWLRLSRDLVRTFLHLLIEKHIYSINQFSS